MPKLATARNIRTYGTRTHRNRWEHVNAGIYIFAAILLFGGFVSLHSSSGIHATPSLVAILVALFLLTTANAHDLIAHLAGIDFCLSLVEFDPQLALVELAVPLFHILGSVLNIVCIVFLLIQVKGYGWRLEKHGANLLIAGPAFWLVGSVLDLCQVYERARGNLQILQKSVQIPCHVGSLLFLVGGIFNKYEKFKDTHHSVNIVGNGWVWMSLCGSVLYLFGGLMNAVKVSKMQRMDESTLEKLRGGAHERLMREREGRLPLILEGRGRRRPL